MTNAYITQKLKFYNEYLDLWSTKDATLTFFSFLKVKSILKLYSRMFDKVWVGTVQNLKN